MCRACKVRTTPIYSAWPIRSLRKDGILSRSFTSGARPKHAAADLQKLHQNTLERLKATENASVFALQLTHRSGALRLGDRFFN